MYIYMDVLNTHEVLHMYIYMDVLNTPEVLLVHSKYTDIYIKHNLLQQIQLSGL